VILPPLTFHNSSFFAIRNPYPLPQILYHNVQNIKARYKKIIPLFVCKFVLTTFLLQLSELRKAWQSEHEQKVQLKNEQKK